MEIRMEKCKELKQKPDQKHLGFGKYMTDYMFVMDWTKDEGWKDARIVPYAPITLEPACVTLHYAQETFEGMKAYRTAEGKIQLFRPEMNAKRMINSNARLCMPEVPEDISDHLCLQQKVLLECIWQLHINSWSSAVR